MNSKQLSDLQPASQASENICAALERCAQAKGAAGARAMDAEGRLEAGKLVLTSKERRLLQDDLDDANQDAGQAQAIADALAPALAAALHQEAHECAAASYTAMKVRLTVHEAGFLESYRELQTAMVELLAERGALIEEIIEHDATAKSFSQFQIGGTEEMGRAAISTVFFKTKEEIEAQAKFEQNERDRLKWAALEVRERDFAARAAYAAQYHKEQAALHAAGWGKGATIIHPG